MALDNDVKPAEYEAENARLNAQVASLQRQNREQRQQLVQTIQSLQQRLQQAWRVLWIEAENIIRKRRTQAYTTELSQAGRAIVNTIGIITDSNDTPGIFVNM